MELLNHCRDHAHKFYGDLFMAAEKTISDMLFEQAEQSTSNDDQRRYFEAMQQLKANSGVMQTTFQQALKKSYQAFVDGLDQEISIDEAIDANSLTLVQRDDLEDELAISVIVSKSNSRNSETLWKLNRRLAVLRGGKNVSDETNPFGPAKVCAAAQQAVTQLSFDSKTKIMIYKQLGKVFVLSFAKELDGLNSLLVEKGILANLRFSAAAQSSQQSTQSTTPASDSTEQESVVEPAQNIAHQQQLYSAIRQLQSNLGPRTETAGGVSFAGIPNDGSEGGKETFSAVDYALALSAIQQSKAFLSAASQNRSLAAEKVEEQLFHRLSQQSDPTARHKMSQGDADTVDLVGMIFRYMLDDANLHDAVKSLLSHLHTPYLKLALMDKTFLDNYQHSARVLLNTMADIGGKWVKEDNDRTVLPKIKSIVETVLKGFIDDAGIFDQLLEDFLRFKDNLEKRSRMVEKRNTESQQGLEKLELSKQRAVDEITSRLQQADIPEKIATLLHKPWADFLAFNLLRHGDQSLTWQSALKVVDGVVWSVRPAAVANNKADFQRHQTDLEQSVSEGLQTIGYDPEASKGLLLALKEAQELAYHSSVMQEVADHNQKAEQSGSDKVAATAPQPPAEKTTTKATAKIIAKPKKPLAPPMPPLSEEEQSIVERLKEIAFGTWFEFDREKVVQSLKLAWYSKVTSHYMFVDQTGVKQAVENQYNLAKGMAAGNIRIAKPLKKSFMERALEAVFDKLKLSA
ncbi:DUF1631 domain-containing protein [Oceanicoccus sp. KOV_DT_Chl]|uniref:DUF1631 domain-containing protein n=1 Tax=Oceanicoccus sp. KOV_DT_Chl TaxID=1904639 RepID=UPI0013588677|nr:DUF1631 domain-containing protein [Oceanicoccus sp. KOV_DT_Chl]